MKVLYNLSHGIHQTFPETAADTAARQFAHGAFTAAEQRAVDPHFSKLVHQDHGTRRVERLLSDLVQNDGGLPRTEKASDDVYEHGPLQTSPAPNTAGDGRNGCV